ncbi:MAG TPA: hypothetical protein VMU89_07760 [Thermomicrobiaceae bacterium]|nr:hypothetical protein [Thermomicrobiaceae bacterium]
MAWSARPAAADPRPIPSGLTLGDLLLHVEFPYFGNEVSTITDFNGFVAAEMQGAGTATDASGSHP